MEISKFRWPPLMMIFSLICFVLVSSPVLAQSERTVKGIVYDADHLPIIGAAVIQTGTSNGVMTSLDGTFEITLKAGQESVEVSCIGFSTQIVDLKGRDQIKVTLKVEALLMEEVSVVAYGYQKKETVTGSLSSVGTDQLLASPNPSIANSLSGQLSGVSTVQTSGQPGLEDPQIFVRGAGSLNNNAPLILVDGIEMSFFQMDPNEIENITVLKDASATAVFGVRGANGVILVTTRRGNKGKAKISWSSSVGLSHPTRLLKMADSYTTAIGFNELELNDGTSLKNLSFQPFVLEAFRTGSDPIMFPDTDWYDYLTKKASLQTQHNINISGGTDKVRYFASLGVTYQDGIMKSLPGLDYNDNYSYTRYNFRTNLDIDVTKTTTLKLSIGGILGDRNEPVGGVAAINTWRGLMQAQPFSSPGIIDGHVIRNTANYFGSMNITSGLDSFYGHGFNRSMQNTMNLNLELNQKLDMITKGLSFQIKGAYNTKYTFSKTRKTAVETWVPYFKSSVDGSGLEFEDPGFDKTPVYRIEGKNKNLDYSENSSKARDWYFEASLRYNRRFGGAHNVGALLLYNQSKSYYPKQFTGQPTAYVGLVGRITYDYKTRYMAEFNVGYNGSENFAPGKRYGFFPALSFGWILTEEKFMKNQNVFNYLKLRVTCGLVGNDNMANNRYLYLPSSYNLKKPGYNFGYDQVQSSFAAIEGRIGNPNVTWETALKQNYGFEAKFLRSRLKLTADYFRENRSDILISRKTIPGPVSLGSNIVPVVNMGRVRNHGFEVELKWQDKVDEFSYWITGNTSFARNKILFMDEVEPNFPYMARTGRPMGLLYGYKAEGFYRPEDFDENGDLDPSFPVPTAQVHPGDVIYEDLNNDGVINDDDQTFIGHAQRPELTFGLNMGFSYKGFDLTLNFAGAANRSIFLSDEFRYPFGNTGYKALPQYMYDNRWTADRADVATMPRFSRNSRVYNYMDSSLWVRNAGYFRLKTLKLGYTFPDLPGLKKMGVSNLNVYFSGYNLFTIDKVKYMDPETPVSRNNASYPITQTFNFGFSVNF